MLKPNAKINHKNDKSQQKSKFLIPIPSKLIDFTPRSQTHSIDNRYAQRIDRNSLESYHLNKKINKMLRLSFMPSNKSEEENFKTSQRSFNFGGEIQVQSDTKKQEIFSIPKIIKNLNKKLNPNTHNDTEPLSSSKRKNFKEESSHVQKLKTKDKFTTLIATNNTTDKKIEIPQKNSDFQAFQIQETENVKNFQRTTLKQPISYRSKTMHVDSKNYGQKSISYSYKKVPFDLENETIKESFKNVNRHYEKFQNCFWLTQNKNISPNSKQAILANMNKNKNQENLPSANSIERDLKLTKVNKAYQSEPKKKITKQPQQKLKETLKKQIHFSSSTDHSSNLFDQSKSRLKIMIKSNSNNKGFRGQKRINFHESKKPRDLKKRIINFKQEEGSQNQSIKYINLTSYENNESERKNGADQSERPERIHHPSAQKLELNKTQSKKSTNKKPRYLHFERNMKLSNNIHIVITENNKTKINIFHNSLLLKEDPQKVDVLTSLVRDASRLGNGQHKIQIPMELEINKLKIQEKNLSLSGRQSRKQIQMKLHEGIKKDKQKRKQSVPRTRTERKYQIVFEEVQPWEINDQRELQESHHAVFNEKDFTYINSKTIY